MKVVRAPIDDQAKLRPGQWRVVEPRISDLEAAVLVDALQRGDQVRHGVARPERYRQPHGLIFLKGRGFLTRRIRPEPAIQEVALLDRCDDRRVGAHEIHGNYPGSVQTRKTWGVEENFL